MYKIAIIQFPGSNCEMETARAVDDVGMDGVIWRWNQEPGELSKFDGYIIPGGFSYEDRVRAGVVAANDPVMQIVREQADDGKPVLGICNGAQILVEAGMVPGRSSLPSSSGNFLAPRVSSPGALPLQKSPEEGFFNQERVYLDEGRDDFSASALATANEEKIGRKGGGEGLSTMLAVNKRMGRGGELEGVGYYNEWVYMRSDHDEGRTAFTIDIQEGFHFRLPIAHGEGRFLVPQNNLDELIKQGQAVFRYCDANGEVDDAFPVNPNGSLYALAGVCNESGNVLALMPHPERTEEGRVIFESMKKYIESGHGSHGTDSRAGAYFASDSSEKEALSVQEELHQHLEDPLGSFENNMESSILAYQPSIASVEILVELIITDNTAETLLALLKRNGISNLRVKRYIHWEVEVQSNVLGADEGSIYELPLQSVVIALIKSDELLNVNKEIPLVRFKDQWYTYEGDKFRPLDMGVEVFPKFQNAVLVRDYEDLVGMQKFYTLRTRLRFDALRKVERGVVWQFEGIQKDEAREFVLKNNILANPAGQVILNYNE